MIKGKMLQRDTRGTLLLASFMLPIFVATCSLANLVSYEPTNNELSHPENFETYRQNYIMEKRPMSEGNKPSSDLLAEQAEFETNKRRQQPEGQATSPIRQSVGVINGNHATYVEPPADFKPIIYDYQARDQQPPASSESLLDPTSYDQSITSQAASSSSNQVPISSSSAPQAVVVAESRFPHVSDPLLISQTSGVADHLSASGNVGRDTASNSIHQPTRSQQFSTEIQDQLLTGDQEQVKTEREVPSESDNNWNLKPSIGRWSDWHDMSIEPDLASSDSAASLQYAPMTGFQPRRPFVTTYTRDPAILLQRNHLYSGQRSAVTATSGPQEMHSQQKQLQGSVKGLMRQQQAKLGNVVALNLQQISRSSKYVAPLGNPVGKKQATSGQQPPLLGSTGYGSKRAGQLVQLQPTNQLAPVALQSQLQHLEHLSNGNKLNELHQPQRRLVKRRKKTKMNAEVRIQQLVAASQQVSSSGKVGGVARGGVAASNQQQPDNQRRVPLAPSLQAINYNPPTTTTNSTTLSNQSTKKQIKKRRIKTLLPVGLSSWFLGGIRDLDGRHWHLPADIATRLAVNDVDFNNQTPKVVPPSAGSVIILTESDGSTQSPTTRRVPINQLIPR